MKIDADILILHGIILTMNSKMEIIVDGGIAIEGNIIAEIGKSSDIEKKYCAKKVIDAESHIVMPGFINTHTHAAMVYFRGVADDMPLQEWLHRFIWPLEKYYLRPLFVKNAMELAAAEMLLSGITTFNDMYFFEDEAGEVCSKIGIRSFLGEGVLSFPAADWPTSELALRYIKDLYKKYEDDDLITVYPAPHAIYSCSKDALIKSKAVAEELDTPLHIHLSETKEEVEECLKKHHLRPVEYLEKVGFLDRRLIIAHGVWMSNDEIELIAKKGASVSINIESNMKLASGIPPVREYLEKGVCLSIGTDGAASNNNLDILSEMDTLIKCQKIYYKDPAFLSASNVVRFATINGARALGVEEKLGSLETGKLADLILISLDEIENLPIYNYYSHLVYTIGRKSVDTVIVNGKILVENHRLKTIDVDRVKENAKKFSQNLKEKISKIVNN